MDLTTDYMGLHLRSPLVASASPLAKTPAGVERLADAGVGAVVLPSLFEEQLRREALQDARLAEAGTESFPESLSYLPDAPGQAGSRRYLSLLERAAAAVDVPVIASLNGVTAGGWTDYASAMEQAGAAVSIPVAVKLGPYFSSIGEIALRLDKFGADGLVLFNRFMQPDIDPETLTVSTALELSSPAEARLPRAWIALLRGRVRASLAGSTGVEEAADAAAYLLAGADVVMTTSSLLRHGPGHAAVLLDGLATWMKHKGFGAVADLRGLLRVPAGTDQAAYGRGGYLTAIQQATRPYQSSGATW